MKIPPPQDQAQYEAWRHYIGWMEMEEARRRVSEDRRRNFVMLWAILAVLALLIWLAGPALGLAHFNSLMLLKSSVFVVALAAITLGAAIIVEQRAREHEAEDKRRSFELEGRITQLDRVPPAS